MAIEIRLPKDPPACWLPALCLLYKPLVGNEAILLYEALYSLAAAKVGEPCFVKEEDLAALLQTTPTALKTSRERLEKFELLRSFENGSKQLARILVCPPKTPPAFFSDEVLRRLLYQAVDREGVKRLQAVFEPKEQEEEDLVEVTQTLDLAHFEKNWTVQKEEDLGSTHMDWSSSRTYDFNWDIFLRGAQRRFPVRLRTQDNLNRIARLANVYGISEQNMIVLVTKHTNARHTQIDFDGILNELGVTKKVETGKPDDYSQAPVSFLKARQPANAKVLPKERALLLSLAETHHFSNELINTIIEYSMEQCQGSLVEKYVRTLANNMARSQIETRDQALEFFCRAKKAASTTRYGQAKNAKPNLPDWYDIIPTEKGTEEDVEAILALQNQFLVSAKTGEDEDESEQADPSGLLQDQSSQNSVRAEGASLPAASFKEPYFDPEPELPGMTYAEYLKNQKEPYFDPEFKPYEPEDETPLPSFQKGSQPEPDSMLDPAKPKPEKKTKRTRKPAASRKKTAGSPQKAAESSDSAIDTKLQLESDDKNAQLQAILAMQNQLLASAKSDDTDQNNPSSQKTKQEKLWFEE